MNVAYNRDCMDVMKEYPDGYFDLAVVDPPYGDALHTDGGGDMGWFTKYREDSRDGSRIVHVERERERGRPIDHLHSSRRQEERRRLGTDSGDCSTSTRGWNRFGQRFDRYKHEAAPIPRGKQEPERPVEPIPQTVRRGGYPEQGEHGPASTRKKTYRGT